MRVCDLFVLSGLQQRRNPSLLPQSLLQMRRRFFPTVRSIYGTIKAIAKDTDGSITRLHMISDRYGELS